MKIKLDENLPSALRHSLLNQGHDVDTVSDEGLVGAEDAKVWANTQSAGRFFVTQDLDFSDIRRYLPGSHFGILLVRLDNPSRSDLAMAVEAAFHSENVESWSECFVVLTNKKIRINRPS